MQATPSKGCGKCLPDVCGDLLHLPWGLISLHPILKDGILASLVTIYNAFNSILPSMTQQHCS